MLFTSFPSFSALTMRHSYQMSVLSFKPTSERKPLNVASATFGSK